MSCFQSVPCANVVVCGHPEGVATGRVQPRQFVVSLAPKVTFSENAVLLSLRMRGKKGAGQEKNKRAG